MVLTRHPAPAPTSAQLTPLAPLARLLGRETVTDVYEVAYGQTVRQAYVRLRASLAEEFPAWGAVLSDRGYDMLDVSAIPLAEAERLAQDYLALLTDEATGDPWRVVPVRGEADEDRPVSFPLRPTPRPYVLPGFMFFGWVARP